MSKGKINGAIKPLTNKMENGILPLNEKMLKQKHPEPKDAPTDVLFNDKVPVVHSIRYEEINAELIRKVALKTRGGAGPSGLDGDGWKRQTALKKNLLISVLSFPPLHDCFAQMYKTQQV